MSNYTVGPFLVHDPTPAELADVQAVVARLPAAMRTPAGGLVNVHFRNKPKDAPPWAIGYTIGENNFWVNPKKNSDTRQYLIAHEYWHEWSKTHSSYEQQIRRLVVGNTGSTQTSKWTNNPNEAMAHGFAKAMGFSALESYDFRAYIPASSYSHVLQTLGGSSNLPVGTPVVSPTPGGSVDPPNRVKAYNFLAWWNANSGDHDITANWDQILERFVIDTNDQDTADYIRDVLARFNIDTKVATGPGMFGGSTDTILTYLGTVAAADPSLAGGDFLGISSFFGQFTQSISHGFYFLIFIIIGLVILLAGMRAGLGGRKGNE